MSADERRHGPVELAELPGRPGYEVEGEVEQAPAHHPRCGCFECRLKRTPRYVHRPVRGAPYMRTGACGVSVGVEALDSISGPQFANEGEAVTCPGCLAKP